MTGLGRQRCSDARVTTDIDTTMGYVKLTEDLSGAPGTPFALLPARLRASEAFHLRIRSGKDPSFLRRNRVPEEGVEPPT